MARHRFLLGAAVLSLLAAVPLHGQQLVQDWQYRWYWGANGALVNYKLPTNGNTFVPSLGGEWLITKRRAALYIGYARTFQTETDTFQIQGTSGTTSVSFDGMRRIQVAVLVMVGSSALQPYVGGGFIIETLTNAHNTGTSTSTVDQAIFDAASGGFGMVMAGAQWRMGRKLAIFGHFQYTAQGSDFLLAGGSGSLAGGLRYAFLGSREADATSR
jgi:hypothetical protein